MFGLLASVVEFIESKDGELSKSQLEIQVAKRFDLIKDRSVFFNGDVAIRFSTARSRNFGNTVLSLSSLLKYDDRPFVVCLVTPEKNFLLLSNTTFLKKISHSSKDLTDTNIKGSFNGSDIVRELAELENEPKNFINLFSIHESTSFEENLERLVEATNMIVSRTEKWSPSAAEKLLIMQSPQRARGFVNSTSFQVLFDELQDRVSKYETEILLASQIENNNIRGRIVEFLITSDDPVNSELHDAIQQSLRQGRNLPNFKTKNQLGDYQRSFAEYETATDIKTKVLMLASSPKGYNIDKFLEFCSADRSVFMFLLVGLSAEVPIRTRLVSVFDSDLLSGTRAIHHWAGRSTRGVTQFDGQMLHEIIHDDSFANRVDLQQSGEFLEKLLAL